VNKNSVSPLIVAIDVGTTSAKGLLVQPDGNVINAEQEFYETSFPQPGFAEQDPDSILQSVFQIIRKITLNENISGLCFSTAMHSLMAVDNQGKPLTKLILWSDTRSANQSARVIENNQAQKLYEITGTPIHPMSPLCKILWLKENQPEIFSSAFKFISIKEYILYHLTGEFVVDYSIASATGLFDIDGKRWSTEALRLVNLTEEKLSRPVLVTTQLKIIKDVGDFRLSNIPLIVGASDGCLAQLGSHAMNKKDLSITLGTSGAVRVATSERKIDPQGKVFNYILDDENFICGGATNGGTVLLNWYCKNIDSTASEDIVSFVNQVSEVPPGCLGLLMIPHLFGERAPIYNPNARGIFYGISVDHGKRHFQRALIEGICFQIRWIMECVEDLTGQHETILISGGFTRSENWIQILCDVLGKSLSLQETQDASTIGAVILGFRSLGVEIHFENKKSKRFTPNQDSHRIYTQNYLAFRKLYSAITIR
jgi:gluconokinase